MISEWPEPISVLLKLNIDIYIHTARCTSKEIYQLLLHPHAIIFIRSEWFIFAGSDKNELVILIFYFTVY